MKFFRVEKNNCDDLGFSIDCLFLGAIDLNEFKQWITYVIENQEEYPTYFFEILDLKEEVKTHVLKVMPYHPNWQHSKVESHSISGVSYKRFLNFVSDNISRKAALEALSKNPNIEERFKETFPFIELPE